MKRKTPIYHVGLLVVGHTAVFQYRRCVDFLSCEILKYYGKRETTKALARGLLQLGGQVTPLMQLNKDFPGRNFTKIVID